MPTGRNLSLLLKGINVTWKSLDLKRSSTSGKLSITFNRRLILKPMTSLKIFKEAVSKASNLVYQNSIGFIRKAAQYFPEDVRQMFRTLYDEEIPLEDRFRQFTESAEELLPRVIEKQGKKLNHQQDERTLSYYLTMRFPEKYPLYKDETYKYLLSIMGNPDAKPAGEKYFHYLELTEKLVFTVESESELVKTGRKPLDGGVLPGRAKVDHPAGYPLGQHAIYQPGELLGFSMQPIKV